MIAAEARFKVDSQADLVPAEIEKPQAPETAALVQDESVREIERKSLERAEAAQRAVTAIQVADKRHKLPAEQPRSSSSPEPSHILRTIICPSFRASIPCFTAVEGL